ncbi:methyl-CpG-binding domain-containing protein 5-like [Malus sylvestris]|uniref:methyl-CpG-binding domain-containing protein 5-like n=1 Tax=Malus sylvestris TaxID=3752 RepID=UPI0021AD041D|nr:methyl-CpG-binding domain-containing protein 5-like [Malus sylvestris]
MSVPEASCRNMNADRRPSFSDHRTGTLHSDSPHDPLLRPGSFIDATTTATTSNGRTPIQTKNPHKAPQQSNRSEPGAGAESTEGGAGRAKRKGVSEPLENWLPPGWSVQEKVRSSGLTAGSTDRYYFDPVSGRRFRSKIEVLRFLETGTTKKAKTENASADKTSVEGSGSQKQKKSSTKPKNSALNFDYTDVPEKVEWALTDSSGQSWTPFIDNKKVPESTSKEWAAAFALVPSKK